MPVADKDESPACSLEQGLCSGKAYIFIFIFSVSRVEGTSIREEAEDRHSPDPTLGQENKSEKGQSGQDQ